MADAYHDSGGTFSRADRYQADEGARWPIFSDLLHLAGGLLSVALIVGTGVWGYKLAVRDVSGVPVVRALEGPIRVAPEDPGGARAEHQGLAVNEVAADGGAGPMGDRLILAPPPLELSEEDVPPPRADPAPAAPVQRAAPAPVGDPGAGEIDDAPEDSLATDRAVAEALQSAEPEPLGMVKDDRGISRSPRPRLRSDLRPTLARMTLDAPALPRADVTAAAEVSPDSLPAGTRLVQLGAFDSPEMARAQWDRIGTRFATYFAGKSRVVQRAESGGKAFYRLRAMGFEDLADARRFCSALLAKSADCIPVVVR